MILGRCPFCGVGCDWCGDHDKDDTHDCHIILCPSCGATFDFNGPDLNQETMEELRAKCAEKFNKRVWV